MRQKKRSNHLAIQQHKPTEIRFQFVSQILLISCCKKKNLIRNSKLANKHLWMDELKFKNKKLDSILSEYNSIKVEINMIEFDDQFVISDSLFVFHNNTTMFIDLRE